MRNDEANDRRRRVPLVSKSPDICCGCGTEMSVETADVPMLGKNLIIRIWCDKCVPVTHDLEEEGERFDGEVCPRCNVETKDLHPDDGLCPKCEGEWVKSYGGT